MGKVYGVEPQPRNKPVVNVLFVYLFAFSPQEENIFFCFSTGDPKSRRTEKENNIRGLEWLDRFNRLDQLDRLDRLDQLDRLDGLERLDRLARLDR